MLLKWEPRDQIPLADLGAQAAMWLNATRADASPRTTLRRIVSVRSFSKWAGHPCLTEYKGPTPGPPVPHPLAEGKAGIVRLLDVCRNDTERALVGMMGLCGARVSEALAAKPDWFDMREQLVTIRGKGDKTRVVPISPDALEAVSMRWVSASINNTRLVMLEDRQARAAVKRLGVKAGLSRAISTHDLRHTFATELLDKGVQIRVVQELLGHSNVNTTQGYTGVKLEAMRSAVIF